MLDNDEREAMTSIGDLVHAKWQRNREPITTLFRRYFCGLVCKFPKTNNREIQRAIQGTKNAQAGEKFTDNRDLVLDNKKDVDGGSKTIHFGGAKVCWFGGGMSVARIR